MKVFTLCMMVLMLGWTGSAIAQTPDGEGALDSVHLLDEEEELDNAIQNFGYLSGIAFQCVSGTEAPMIEGEAMQVFTELTRLFGSDRAFFYAAAYGSGAVSTIEVSRCDDAVSQFRAMLQDGALEQEEGEQP